MIALVGDERGERPRRGRPGLGGRGLFDRGDRPCRPDSSCRRRPRRAAVTATRAPLSRSTACSALCARCVRPSFIFVIFASGSDGFCQSVFDVRFFRRRSSRARASRVGVLIPDSVASRVRNSWYVSPVSRRTMLRIAALASSVVASTATVWPFSKPAAARRSCTQVKTARCALQRDQPPRPRDRRVIRGRRVEAEPDEARARPASPRRATRSRARSRALRSSRPAASGSTGPAADSAAPSPARRTADTPLSANRSKLASSRMRVQLGVERMPRRDRQFGGRHPHRRLLALPFAHCHGRSVRGHPLRAVLLSPTFTTGC